MSDNARTVIPIVYVASHDSNGPVTNFTGTSAINEYLAQSNERSRDDLVAWRKRLARSLDLTAQQVQLINSRVSIDVTSVEHSTTLFLFVEEDEGDDVHLGQCLYAGVQQVCTYLAENDLGIESEKLEAFLLSIQATCKYKAIKPF